MLNKLGKILVAIDLSEPSFNALDTAVALAQRTKAKLYGIYIQDDPLELIGTNTLTVRRTSDNAANILTALANDIRGKSGVDISFIEGFGHITEMVLKNALGYKCDLIIAGTYGVTGYRNGHIGTTAYNIIKYAPCPVMLVPAGKKWESFKRPLLPVRPVITALRHYDIIRNIMEAGATLNVLALYPNGQHDAMYDVNELVAKVDDKLTADKVKAKVTLCKTVNAIPQTVLLEAEQSGADLIVVTPATDVSNKQFYIGPNTHYIIHNAKVPLLVINKVNRYVMENSGASL